MCFCQILADSKRFPVFEGAKIHLSFSQFPSSFDVSQKKLQTEQPFSQQKKLAPRRLIPLRSKELCKMVMGKCLMRSVKNNKKKVFQLVMGRARKPDPRRCFFKNFVVTYQPPPLLGHRVSDRFGGENERM